MNDWISIGKEKPSYGKSVLLLDSDKIMYIGHFYTSTHSKKQRQYNKPGEFGHRKYIYVDIVEISEDLSFNGPSGCCNPWEPTPQITHWRELPELPK